MTTSGSSASGVFAATHVVPASGLAAFNDPDDTKDPAAHLDPGLDVQEIETQGQWARVRCSNGWEAWVKGDRLVVFQPAASEKFGASTASIGPPAQSPSHSVDDVGLLAILGAALVIIGSFLAWWKVGSTTLTAWDIPIKFLLTGNAGGGVDIGPFLLVVLLLMVPLVTRRSLPAWALPLISVIPLAAGGCALIRGLRESPAVHPGIGLLLTLAGGALIFLQTRGIGSFGLRRSRQ